MTTDNIHHKPLDYALRLQRRPLPSIDLVVIHCTELPDLETARHYGEKIHYPDSKTGNSGHLYIDRDGTIESWVEEDRVAHHVRGYNERSIGIELVNSGRWPNWLGADSQSMPEAYPVAQVNALTTLLRSLCQKLPSLCWIAGHEQLDRERVPATDDPAVMVRRKMDPGPLFPWARVLAAVPLEPFPK